MKKKSHRSAFKHFFKLNPLAPVSGLSYEILCTPIAKETAKLPNVKVEGLKKNCCSAQSVLFECGPRFESWIFFVSPTFTSDSLAVP